MFFNYLNIALRNVLKNKVHTVINVAGLSLGLACTFLIGLYVRYELSYDRFHDNAENLYRVAWVSDNPQTRTPHPMAQALVHDFPEVANAVSLSPLWAAGLTREVHSFKNPAKAERYDEANILSVDTTFFDVFPFPLVQGNPKNALKNIGGVLISELMAKKYFGTENAVGKQLYVDGDKYLVEVTGVFSDVPKNSHFHFDFLVSYLREKSFDPENEYYSWKDFGHYNYIRLKPGSDPKALEAKLLPWIRKYVNFSDEQFHALSENNFGLKLQPVTDIHLKSRVRWELEPNGNIEYVYILGAAALLTLIIACINFMNLTTAKSAERAKEIGVRKTLGAYRNQLSLQFLAESVVTSVFAVLVAIFLIEVSLPVITYMIGMQITIEYGSYFAILLLLGLITGLVSGAYPALYLSGIRPNIILKGKMIQSREGSALRSGLIVFQFCMSMILICSAVIIYSQLNFLKTKDLGFTKEQVVIIPLKQDDGFQDLEVLRNELVNNPNVLSVSASSNIPGKQFNQNDIASIKHPEEKIDASEVFVDYDFIKALNIEVAEGRFFQRDNPADTAGFVLNETAARQLFFDQHATGEEIVWSRSESTNIRGNVIGVVKDFNFQSLHEPIRPLLFVLTKSSFNNIIVKTKIGDLKQTLSSIEASYKKVQPYFGFEFFFLDDLFNNLYASEQQTGSLLWTFSVIAVLIAAFGLFGISLLTFHQKIKELSVRKILGASSANLLVLLLSNFTRLIVIAIVIAVPLVWWGMNRWLDNFNEKVGIDVAVFVVSGISLLAIAWITLLYFGYRASRLNPAETLKNE
jgi:putative ABC transport system permease protein